MVPTEELRRSIPSPLGVTLQPLRLCSSEVTAKLLWVIEATCASLLRLAHIPRPPFCSPISTLLLHRPICSRHVKSLTFTTLIKSHLLPSKCSQQCSDNQAEFQPLDGDKHTAGMIFFFYCYIGIQGNGRAFWPSQVDRTRWTFCREGCQRSRQRKKGGLWVSRKRSPQG